MLLHTRQYLYQVLCVLNAVYWEGGGGGKEEEVELSIAARRSDNANIGVDIHTGTVD